MNYIWVLNLKIFRFYRWNYICKYWYFILEIKKGKKKENGKIVEYDYWLLQINIIDANDSFVENVWQPMNLSCFAAGNWERLENTFTHRQKLNGASPVLHLSFIRTWWKSMRLSILPRFRNCLFPLLLSHKRSYALRLLCSNVHSFRCDRWWIFVLLMKKNVLNRVKGMLKYYVTDF